MNYSIPDAIPPSKDVANSTTPPPTMTTLKGRAMRWLLEAVMNSISNGLGMRNTGTSRKPNRLWNPHFYAIFTQVHNTL
jgi:hypothetical protein